MTANSEIRLLPYSIHFEVPIEVNSKCTDTYSECPNVLICHIVRDAWGVGAPGGRGNLAILQKKSGKDCGNNTYGQMGFRRHFQTFQLQGPFSP
jgi:hypothetical protein